jgi:hypothetical protein|tara:strand:- start:800 stop:1111 length:312 start_codon:yes stop_codon:yes gene_type:complete
MNWKEFLRPIKGKLIIYILIILLLVIGVFFLMMLNIRPTDGPGWSKKCQLPNDCAFVEKVNVPVPGPEGCYSIEDNPAIKNQNLVSNRKECECINNVCQVKTE